ncbi:MAG: WYL domain-containing protein, partial [Actinomycetota bacterium]|nr:WYL domain-containing protein [Actinomycetota bacterium]
RPPSPSRSWPPMAGATHERPTRCVMTERLERLINLVIALRETRRPLTAAEIRERVAGYGQEDAEAFRRMFERDKAELRTLGVPVETAPLDPWEDTVGYRIDPRRYDLPEVSLEPRELAALAVALQATGLTDEAGLALRKLEVDAGQPGTGRPESALPVGVDLEAPHRDLLMAAQMTRTTVRFAYRPLDRAPADRTVDPHALVHRRGRWYLVGRDHARDQRRAFRLDRIVGRVRTVGEPGAFPAPAEDISVDAVVPAAPVGTPESAEVVASPAVAWQVARRAGGAGRPEDDGWVGFTVAVGDPEDFLAWALTFGPDLEIRSPTPLREQVIARLERAAGGPP